MQRYRERQLEPPGEEEEEEEEPEMEQETITITRAGERAANSGGNFPIFSVDFFFHSLVRN